MNIREILVDIKVIVSIGNTCNSIYKIATSIERRIGMKSVGAIITIKKLSIMFFCMLALSGCGRSTVQECVYRDENVEFSVTVPISWSYAIHKQVKDENGQKLYNSVDIILYPDREETNRICIFHQENGETLAVEEGGIDIKLNSRLHGTLMEDINNWCVTRYIVLDGGEYGILVLCRPKFYEENIEAIDKVLASLKIE